MKQNAPTPSRAIQIITTIYFLLTVGLFVVGLKAPVLLAAALLLLLLGAYCYWFWSPVAYELEGDTLTVHFRASRMVFPAVSRCSPMEKRSSLLTLRLWGNGGVFAGSGIFWNKRYGVFRAYVTRSKAEELVLVESARGKVIISPERPEEFLGQIK